MKKALLILSALALATFNITAMADSSSAQVNLTATVTGTANISVAQATPAFPSATITQIQNGQAPIVPASNIIMYNDANPTNGYNVSITSSNTDANGAPVLQSGSGSGASKIPLNVSITSCGTGTAITFPSGYNNPSSSITGNNATSYACQTTPGQISYSLGTPSSAINAGSYTGSLTFNIQQL